MSQTDNKTTAQNTTTPAAEAIPAATLASAHVRAAGLREHLDRTLADLQSAGKEALAIIQDLQSIYAVGDVDERQATLREVYRVIRQDAEDRGEDTPKYAWPATLEREAQDFIIRRLLPLLLEAANVGRYA